MSSQKEKSDDKKNNSSTSSFAIGAIAATAGIAIGAGLAYFLRPSNESPQCHASASPRNLTCDSCSICIDKLDVLFLPCSHGFHRECVLKWLRKCPTCPICRAEIPHSFILAS